MLLPIVHGIDFFEQTPAVVEARLGEEDRVTDTYKRRQLDVRRPHIVDNCCLVAVTRAAAV